MPLVERGFVPETVVRWGIRRLNAERLEQERARFDANRLSRFVDELRRSRIALMPEKANEQHYELPAAFFELVLGKHLKYSGCYWSEGALTLDEAEAHALSLICERAEIADGMDILELGCGWGSLSLWLAQQYRKANIVAISNSHSQREFIEERCRKLGLGNVRVVTCDMNDFSTDATFDRVVSIEMFEHMRNYEALLGRIAEWMRSDAKLFVHIFCHQRYPYLFETNGAGNWMGRHFFTSGMMPSVDLLPQFQQDLSLEKQWYLDGRHYAKTAESWLANLDAHRESIMPVLRRVYGNAARKWFVRWRLFFLACAELFRYEDGQQWGVGHYLFGQRTS